MLKLTRQGVVDALSSFFSAFTLYETPFSFTTDLGVMVEMELFPEDENEELEFEWPFTTPEEVKEAVIEALKREGYVGEIEVELDDSESDESIYGWQITIDAKPKG